MRFMLLKAVTLFGSFIQLLLIVRALMSWVVRNPYSGAGKVYQGIIQLTEPFVAPIRAIQDRYFGQGMLDWSLLIVYFAIELLMKLIVTVLGLILF